jgi:hypothetical protein
MLNEEPIIPDGSFILLNLDPPGDDPANPSGSERGLYLSLSLFFLVIIFLHHHAFLMRCGIQV